MRHTLVGVTSLFLIALLVGGFAGAQPPLKVQVEDETDLNALCDKGARDCWDLDPAAFGMHPVLASLPPVPDGTLAEVDEGGAVKVKAKLLGQQLEVHGVLSVEQRTSRSTDEAREPPMVPCRDPDGCPDLHVDAYALTTSPVLDERTFSADDCSVQEGSTVPGTRRLLRFSFRTPNLGSGDLVIGDPDDHTEWFEWGDCHGHWHFREYADYRLWTPEGYAVWKTLRAAYPHLLADEVLEAFPELQDHYRGGHKQGFCVIDIRGWYYTEGPRNYRSCDDNQGITRTWADEYHAFLDGQWVDVTGLAAGAYVLEAEVNPERFYAEELYNNNDFAVVVQI